MELVLISDGKKYEIHDILYTKKHNPKFKITRNGHTEWVPAGRFRNPVNYTREEITEIPDTFELLSSKDHKDRLVGEYIELCIRYKKLNDLLLKHGKGELGFELNCPVPLLSEQSDIMQRYMMILEKRFRYEDVMHIQGYFDQFNTEDFIVPF